MAALNGSVSAGEKTAGMTGLVKGHSNPLDPALWCDNFNREKDHSYRYLKTLRSC